VVATIALVGGRWQVEQVIMARTLPGTRQLRELLCTIVIRPREVAGELLMTGGTGM
jgi:hypothetical protein